ncbi:MAG: hypothetical protein U0R64_03470 [Candidatus Nanopelagicales bacterium]
MHDFLMGLTPLGCLTLAFVPVTLFAVIGAVLSPRVPAGNDATLTAVLRIGGGALVFIAAFLIGNLWSQANTYLAEVTAEYAAGWNLDDAVKEAVPATQAEAMTVALRTYREEVRATEIGTHVPPDGSPEAQRAFATVLAEAHRARADAAATQDGAAVARAADELSDARDQRVTYPELAGLPGVVIITILVLAWIVSFLMGLFPWSGSRAVKTIQTGAAIVVIGLIQLAVFYLATRAGLIEIIEYSLQF